MTSIADQDVDRLGGRLSILVRQRLDRQQLDALLDRLAAARPGPDQQRDLGRLARLVFPHAFAEESELWPQLRRVLPEGEELTLQVEREHQEVNELWTRLRAAARGRRGAPSGPGAPDQRPARGRARRGGRAAAPAAGCGQRAAAAGARRSVTLAPRRPD